MKSLSQPKSITAFALAALATASLLPLATMVWRIIRAVPNGDYAIWELALGQSRQWLLLINSIGVALGASVLAVVCGAPLAFVLRRIEFPGRRLLQILILAPLLIPPYISAMSWISAFGHAGWMQEILMQVFGAGKPVGAIQGWWGSALVLGMSYLPFVVILTQSGLDTINRSYEEASLLSRNWPKTLWSVTIPLTAPFVTAGGLFVFILAIANYGVPDLMRVNVYPVETFISFSAYYDESRAIACSLPIMAISVGLIFCVKALLGRRPYVAFGAGYKWSRIMCPHRWRWVSVIFGYGILFLAAGIPLTGLIAQAGTLEAFAVAWSTAHAQILTTAMWAAIGATAATLIGFLLAYHMRHDRGVAARGTALFSILPFAFSGIILGIGLIYTWNNSFFDALYGTPAVLVIGYVAYVIPYTTFTVLSGLRQLDRRLEEALLLTNGSWLSRIGIVVLPLCRRSLAAAWAIAFVLCVFELGMTLLVVPPGMATLSVRIYTLLHYGASQIVGALALILVIVGLIPVTIVLWLAVSGKKGRYGLA